VEEFKNSENEHVRNFIDINTRGLKELKKNGDNNVKTTI
jgi:hypothetical protein